MRATVALLLTLSSISCFSTRPVNFDDARISDDTLGALHAEHIDEVTVDVANGHVTLAGSATAEEIQHAVALAERVDGVRSVKNAIRAIDAPHVIRRNQGG